MYEARVDPGGGKKRKKPKECTAIRKQVSSTPKDARKNGRTPPTDSQRPSGRKKQRKGEGAPARQVLLTVRETGEKRKVYAGK